MKFATLALLATVSAVSLEVEVEGPPSAHGKKDKDPKPKNGDGCITLDQSESMMDEALKKHKGHIDL